MSTPSAPDGVDPTVTAVVITRRDPRGLAALLDAVLDQTLAPDAVLVLDRTAGAALPGRDDGPDGTTGTGAAGPAGHAEGTGPVPTTRGRPTPTPTR